MKKNKHDHKGTKALKLSIFFTLMLAPFLAVLFKCAYVTFNKNAKDSYSSVATQDYVNIASNTTLIDNGEYRVYVDSSKLNQTDMTNPFVIGFNKINLNDIETITGFNNVNKIMYHQNGYVNLYHDTTQLASYNKTGDTAKYFLDKNIYFLMNVSNTSIGNNNYDKIKQLNVTYNNLDNAFYYAIDEAMESPYFAWAQTSALYTATSGLTNGMGITTQAIPTLIVYWLILTAIYIIIDIVIESFTYLTHCIMNRFD